MNLNVILVAVVHLNHEAHFQLHDGAVWFVIMRFLIVVKVVVTGTRKICGEPKRVTIGNVGERVDKIRPYFHCLNLSWETIGW